MIRSRMTGAALVLVLSVGGTLAACGGSSDEEGSDTTATTSAPESTSAAPTTEPEGDAGSGDKPSKDDVIAGYTTIVSDGAGGQLPEGILDQVVTCFVDELYEPASAQTLQAIADSEPTGIDPADAQLFGDASTACTAKITG